MNPVQKTLAVIAQARGIEDMIRPEYPNGVPKTVESMLSRLEKACDAAFRAWPQRLSRRDIDRIGSAFDRSGIEGMTRPSEYCPYVLYLITDILSHISDKARRKRLEDVMTAIKAIHRYYDRQLNKEDDYCRSMDTGEQFLEMMV